MDVYRSGDLARLGLGAATAFLGAAHTTITGSPHHYYTPQW